MSSEKKRTLEKGHFIFNFQEIDEPVIADLSKALEDNYDRILVALKYPTDFKTRVNVYPDIATYHKEIGFPNWPDWAIGSVYKGTIDITSPRNPGPKHNYTSIINSIIHEFVHVVTEKKNENMKVTWLYEGVAGYLADNIDTTKQNMKKVLNGKIPQINDMNSNKILFSNNYALEYSKTIVEFIVKKYGNDKISLLIDNSKTSVDFQKIFSITEEEFQHQWENYLLLTYK